MSLFFSYRRGDKGQTVADIQQALNTTQGAKLTVDGIYGAQTDKAVEKVTGRHDTQFRFASTSVFTDIQIPQIAIADISDYQYSVDFEALRAEGVRGVIIKASEGFDWQTKKVERFREAKEAGLLVGAYHFGRPDLHSEAYAPERERGNFNSVIDQAGIRLDLKPVYDFEDGDKNRDSWNVDYCIKWNPGIVYTAKWALDSLAGHDRERLLETGASLWWAEYIRSSRKRYPTKPTAPWDEWSLWQHTSTYETAAVKNHRGEPSSIDMNWTHKGRMRDLLDVGCKA